MYPPQEQAEFQKILRIFKTHLKKTSLYEITYTSFAGYIYIHEDQTITTDTIPTPESLCKLLFHEVAVSILSERHSRTLVPSHASKAAKSAIRKRLAPYLRQLPEYRHLADQLLNGPR